MTTRIARFIVALTFVAGAFGSQIARATPFAYVGDGNVPIHLQVIDVATNTVVASPTFGLDEVDCCSGPQGVAVSPSGDRAYIATSGHGRLFVLDTATNTFLTSIVLNGDPFGVAINAAATRLYVAAYSLNLVYVVDAATNAVLTTIPVGSGPRGVVVSPDGTRIYVANYLGSSISAIDTATNAVVATIPLPNGPFGGPLPEDLVITPNGATVYVTKTNTFEVAVIDTASNTVLTNVNTQNGPQGIAINPAGTRVYVGHGFAGVIKVIDTATNTVVDTISVASQSGLSVTPDGTRLYAARSNSPYAVTVIDTATDAVVTTITGFRPYAFGNFIGPICPAACNDGNPCTIDTCNSVGGCSHTNSPVNAPCNDGLFCNGADTCDGAGGCVNHAGDPCAGGPECAQTCDEADDDCFDPVTTACTSDGNVCTDDHCDGAGACIHSPNNASCDDGLFCDGVDTCAGGACQHPGDPCTGGPECAQTCNEGAGNCLALAGTPCTSDGNVCTVDACNGAGTCAHPAGNAGATCRPAAGQCDVAETCDGVSAACPPDGSAPDGTSCNDGNACTSPDVCSGGTCTGGAPVVCPLCQTCDSVGGCMIAPRTPCKHPTKPNKGSIQLVDRMPDDLDQVKWKWSTGQATSFTELGDPVSTDAYALCVYDADSNPLLQMMAPAGGTCGSKPCWKQLGSAALPKGYKYADRNGGAAGIGGITLKAGLEGKAKMSLKAKGANIPMPGLGSFVLPIKTQLQSTNGQCWEATMPTASVNTATLFKASGE